MNLSDKKRQARDIVLYKEQDANGVQQDVDAKVFYPDGTEVQCSDPRPPLRYEIGDFSCGEGN